MAEDFTPGGYINEMAPPPVNTVFVDANGGAEFSSIKTACDYVATQTPTEGAPWNVVIYHGVYDEDAFTIPSWVSVAGYYGSKQDSWHPVKITFSGVETGTCITMEGSSCLANLAISVPMGDTHTGDVTLIEADGSGSSSSPCGVQGITLEALRSDANDITAFATSGAGGLRLHECYANVMQFGAGAGHAIKLTGSGVGASLYAFNCVIARYAVVGAEMNGSGAGAKMQLCNVSIIPGGGGEDDLTQTAGTLNVLNCPYTDSTGTITALHTTQA